MHPILQVVGFNEEEGGGAERDRTANLRVANAALSQLSYGPGTREKDTRGAANGKGATGPRQIAPGWTREK